LAGKKSDKPPVPQAIFSFSGNFSEEGMEGVDMTGRAQITSRENRVRSNYKIGKIEHAAGAPPCEGQLKVVSSRLSRSSFSFVRSGQGVPSEAGRLERERERGFHF
jgi:hypothetical protein